MLLFCRNCGKDLALTPDKTCANCGANPVKATAFCRYCGHATGNQDLDCPTCGKAIKIPTSTKPIPTSVKPVVVSDKPLMVVRGHNVAVELREDKIRIKHVTGDKDILVKEISSIHLEKPAFFTNGYIRFVLSGGSGNQGGLAGAWHSEDAVVFDSEEFDNFAAIKQAIEHKLSSDKSDKTALFSNLDLKYNRIIAEEDFNLKKRPIGKSLISRFMLLGCLSLFIPVSLIALKVRTPTNFGNQTADVGAMQTISIPIKLKDGDNITGNWTNKPTPLINYAIKDSTGQSVFGPRLINAGSFSYQASATGTYFFYLSNNNEFNGLGRIDVIPVVVSISYSLHSIVPPGCRTH